MNKKSKFYQEKDYYPKLLYPKKYTGSRPITIRSSWEKAFIKNYLDINKGIVEWSSEDVVIPYIFSLDERRHRYFVDFWMKVKQTDGSLKEYLIEIKPYSQTQPPKPPKRQTSKFRDTVAAYIKNQDKWKYAQAFCENLQKKGRDIEFVILTEKQLPL